MRRLLAPLPIAVLCAVVALVVLLAYGLASNEPDRGVERALGSGEREPAPDVDLPRLEGGGNASLADYRGKVVVLNFWASWCGPCKDETPLLQKSWQRWEGKDVVFVGMNVKDFRGDARSFVRRFGVTYPNVYDGKGSTVGRYGVTGFPETYFIDAKGRVVYRIAGPVADAEELDSGIRRALAPA
jgi:cytochrome c biogenesis protein CcmG/thiol:disulfide interchange protein DsbE